MWILQKLGTWYKVGSTRFAIWGVKYKVQCTKYEGMMYELWGTINGVWSWICNFSHALFARIGTHLKWMFSTQTVVQTDSETSIMVKRRYLPSRGTANEVGGIISAKSRKNTVNDTSIEIHNVTCQRNVYTISTCRYLSAIATHSIRQIHEPSNGQTVKQSNQQSTNNDIEHITTTKWKHNHNNLFN